MTTIKKIKSEHLQVSYKLKWYDGSIYKVKDWVVGIINTNQSIIGRFWNKKEYALYQMKDCIMVFGSDGSKVQAQVQEIIEFMIAHPSTISAEQALATRNGRLCACC